jgi:hypothetical protein
MNLKAWNRATWENSPEPTKFVLFASHRVPYRDLCALNLITLKVGWRQGCRGCNQAVGNGRLALKRKSA